MTVVDVQRVLVHVGSEKGEPWTAFDQRFDAINDAMQAALGPDKFLSIQAHGIVSVFVHTDSKGRVESVSVGWWKP